MTDRLYDKNAYVSSFEAVVTDCRSYGDGYAVLLDRTAFFPEGGGQSGDSGSIGHIPVRDTQEEGGEILHLTDLPCEIGAAYPCHIDFALRYDRMQNHSGEHIVSGLVHALYGLDNVGFHLGETETTLDFNGVLDREQLDRVEEQANEAIWHNLPILCEYPTKEQLATLDYRSKKELSGEVRIVTIEGYDCCACCAPHVARTGEIGLIKLLDFIHYKGGVRIWLAAGKRALLDYREKYREVSAVSRALSVPQAECAAGVDRLLAEFEEKKANATALSRELAEARVASLSPNAAGNILYFLTENDELMARKIALGGAERADGVCAVFFPAGGGYRFMIASQQIRLREKAAAIREALAARGGGTDDLLQGSSTAEKEQVTAFFEKSL
ncbi:MAG: alanyl-tRNA editing protein [Clostridia bacterium]|nr:alanyl-tRNA editing protein [Clostridia bacterium]